MNGRTIARVLAAPEVEEGPGFIIRRAIPQHQAPAIGPFLLLDQIGPRVLAPGAQIALAPHPHAGMETVTYLLEGSTEHHDSAGHSETIQDGQVQWMRAGRGIIHAEGPGKPLRDEGGRLHAVQLWINLPEGKKHVDPAYSSYRDLAVVTIGDARVRPLAGEIAGVRGPILTFADPFALHAAFQAKGAAMFQTPSGIELALYVMAGAARVAGGDPVKAGSLIVLGDGDSLAIDTDGLADLLLFGGPALDAPLVRHGPFVMNHDHEIHAVLRDYRTGRMGTLAAHGA